MSQHNGKKMEEFPITVCYKRSQHGNVMRARELVAGRSEYEARKKVLDLYISQGYQVTKIEIDFCEA